MKSTLPTIAATENTGKSTGKTCALAISECALFSVVLLSNMYMAFQAKNGVRNMTLIQQIITCMVMKEKKTVCKEGTKVAS